MFNVGLTYNITDWLNATARFRMDDTHVLFERKIYASSDDKFAEGKKDCMDTITMKTVRNMPTLC